MTTIPLDHHGSGPAAFDPMPQTFVARSAAPALLARDGLNPVLTDVLDFWLTRAAGAAPSRAMIDPVRLRSSLPHIILWDVLPAGSGYRCRLAGTAVCEAAGRELRGLILEEMHGPHSAVVRQEFDTVRDSREAHFVERTMHWVARPYRLYKRLLLPLVDPNGAVDALLGAITVEY